MSDLYAASGMAEGYAKARPPLHEKIVAAAAATLDLKGAQRALDVGCGSGLSTRPLLRLARTVVGIEPSGGMLGWCPRVAPGAAFLVARAEQMPFASESFDLLSAAGSLNYVELAAFFAEAVRVMRSGAWLMVYDFGPGRRQAHSTRLAEWFDSFMQRYPAPPAGSAHSLDPQTLAALPSGLIAGPATPFEIGLELDAGFYLNYMLTETNVAQAVGRGVPLEEIRDWCQTTLAPVFSANSAPILFDGYYACLRKP